jgi:hypothetical protein
MFGDEEYKHLIYKDSYTIRPKRNIVKGFLNINLTFFKLFSRAMDAYYFSARFTKWSAKARLLLKKMRSQGDSR